MHSLFLAALVITSAAHADPRRDAGSTVTSNPPTIEELNAERARIDNDSIENDRQRAALAQPILTAQIALLKDTRSPIIHSAETWERLGEPTLVDMYYVEVVAEKNARLTEADVLKIKGDTKEAMKMADGAIIQRCPIPLDWPIITLAFTIGKNGRVVWGPEVAEMVPGSNTDASRLAALSVQSCLQTELRGIAFSNLPNGVEKLEVIWRNRLSNGS